MKSVVRHLKRSSFSVTVINQTRQQLPLAFFRVAAEQCLRTLHAARGSTIGIVFVGAAAMRQLNGQYRGKDRTTNILAFPYAKRTPGRKGRISGDVVFCVSEARREAKFLGRTLKIHLAVLLVHGMVHLAGYSHDRSSAAQQMEKVEKLILRRINIDSR